MKSLRTILAELVAIDSVSSKSNLPVVEWLEAFLRPLGFALERQEVTPGAMPAKFNLLARRGPPIAGGLALVGHTDTVPYDPAWTDALTLTERDGKLYGRGACDTKGFIACALASARAAATPRAPLHLIFTADEEIGCLGAKALVRAGRVHPEMAIVGEPTQLRPVRGGKGYCFAEVVVRGAEGHSAYPDRGASALAGARLFLDALDLLAEQLRQTTDASYAPSFTTLNVGALHAGKAKNIIPGEARFTVEWRPLPSQPPAKVSDALRDLAAQVQRLRPRLTVELQIQREDAGFGTAADGRLLRFLESRTESAITVPFGTEAPSLIALGAEAVVFGPGDIRVAHQTGEFVPLGDLERCTAVLSAAIAEFCGAAAQADPG